MKTTVIVPVRNRPTMVSLALCSLLKAGHGTDLDILVIDDGSTDSTPEVLADLARQNASIRIVTSQGNGVAHARNIGLGNLSGDCELVTFLDSDDLCAPDRFRSDVPLFADDPGLAATLGRMVVTNAFDEAGLCPAQNAQSAEITGPHLSSFLFRRSVLEKIGRFDETLEMSEDIDFLLRLFETGERVADTGTLCFYYLRHGENLTRSRATSNRHFAQAVARSLSRRRANPNLSTARPGFDMRALLDIKVF